MPLASIRGLTHYLQRSWAENTLSGVLDWAKAPLWASSAVAIDELASVQTRAQSGQLAIGSETDRDLLHGAEDTYSLNGLSIGGRNDPMFSIARDRAHATTAVDWAGGGWQASDAAWLITGHRPDLLRVLGWDEALDFDSQIDREGESHLPPVAPDDVLFAHILEGELIDCGCSAVAADLERPTPETLVAGRAALAELAAVPIDEGALREAGADDNEAWIQDPWQNELLHGPDGSTALQGRTGEVSLAHVGAARATDGPKVVADRLSVAEGSSVGGNVLDNDDDPDGGLLTAALVAGPEHGTLVLNSDGSFTYVPEDGYDGLDSFVYSASDSSGDTANATVLLTVTPFNEPAKANRDNFVATINTPLEIGARRGVLKNDTDPEGNPFSATLVTGPANGTLSLEEDGSFIYTPRAGFLGEDSFTYGITGGDTATVTLRVLQRGQDRAGPDAAADRVVAPKGKSVSIDVLDNDFDSSGLDPSTVTIVSGPKKGTVDVDSETGEITYQRSGSATGDDSFTYTVADTEGNVSSTSEVTIASGDTPLSLVGFRDEAVISKHGINSQLILQPISMVFLPDNRMLVLSKNGEVVIVDPESGASSSYMLLPNINEGGERGLLDITLDPNFATNGYFYLYYTPASPQHSRIARFQHNENAGGVTSTASPASETVIWQDTDGYLGCCHYGGGLDFGPDGKIWLTTSDKFIASTPGEGSTDVDLMLDLTSTSGKIIRVNPDGSIPDGSDGWAANPWASPHDGRNDSIWAYGLRNPFRARWDETYGQMYIGEVGGNQQTIAHDDLHVASLAGRGAFYGWPFYEGTTNTYVNGGKSSYNPADFPSPDRDPADAAQGDFFSAPIWSLPHNGSGASLTGGEVYRHNQFSMFPSEWDGVYFYGDYTRDYIRYLRLDSSGTQVLGDFAFKPSPELLGNVGEVVSITPGRDGALYYARISTGEVRRIVHDSGNAPPSVVSQEIAPASGEPPFTARFRASVTDPEGDPLTYQLNFGDGTAYNDTVAADGIITVDHVYSTVGNYLVTLSISDPTHIVSAQPLGVTVGDINDAPVISGADADRDVADPGQVVTFTATATDPDNDALTYTWHFGDGTIDTGTVDSAGQVTTSYVYRSEGFYGAYLEVSDGALTTRSPTISVQVGEATTVPVTNGLVLLLESDIKIGLGTGNTVVSWLDGSGKGNNLFGAGNPQLVTGQTPTGKPAIVFDGTGDLLQRVNATDPITGLPGGSANRTVFFVVDYVNPENVTAGVAYGDGAKNQTFGLTTTKTGSLMIQGYASDLPSTTDGVGGGFLVQSAVLANNKTFHYKNGVQIDSDSKTFATDVQKLILGAEIAGAGESQMKIASVLIYDRALTDMERRQVEDFLQAKYITGSSSNTPPAAVAEGFTFIEDTPLSGNVLSNDSDPDGDLLTAALVTGPTQGTLVLNANGSFTYSPALNYNGADSFVYSASDGKGGTANATVSLTGTPVDDLATAVADSYSTAVDTPLTVEASRGVLANDRDPEGDPFSASLVTGPTNGTLSLNPDGSLAYAPNAGFVGQDSFTYQITGGSSAEVRVSVTMPGQGSPVTSGLVASYYSTENVSLAAGNVLAGWLDGSGRGNDLEALGNPTLVEGMTPTGKPAIVFDGTGDLLQRVNATDTLNGLAGGSADRTVFFVVDYINPERVTSGVAYGDGARNQAFGLVTSKAGDLMVQGWGKANDFISTENGVTGGFLVQSVVLSSNTTFHYKNGTLIDSDSKTFATDLQKLVIGAEIGGAGESKLNVAAALIYDRALTDAERMSVETHLQQLFIDETFAFA